MSERDTLEQTLAQLGLIDNEVIVYRFLLDNGPARASQIGQACQFSRTNVYHLTSRLRERGLIEIDDSASTQRFKISAPDGLFALVEEKESSLRLVRKALNEIAPMLTKRFGISHSESGIYPLDSEEELLKGFERLFRSSGEILSLTNFANWNGQFSELYNSISSLRMRCRTAQRLLSIGTIVAPGQDYERNRQSLRILQESIEFPFDISLHQSNLLLIDFSDNALQGVLVKDQALCAALQIVFHHVWESVEQLSSSAKIGDIPMHVKPREFHS